MTHAIYEFALPLPITQAAYRTAQEFASQQPTSDKVEQVRLNTLAVLVVQDYLQMMEIPTNLAAGDSWNPVTRLCADVADLKIPGVGRLECRPVRPNQTTCQVPPETWEDRDRRDYDRNSQEYDDIRVGYVVVQVDESAREAQLLGFVPTVPTEELPLSWLRSPEDLLDYLYDLKTASTPGRALANLGQWLRGIVEEGWQAVEGVINPPTLSPAYAFRSRGIAFRRARLIDLGSQLPHPISLVVEVKSESDQETAIYFQLQSTEDQPLPTDISMTILSEAGDVILTGQSTEILEVKGAPGERFNLQVSLNDTSVTQEFVI
ncbi:MAG: DUF1822 family protein [Leptolyngbyaceae cyanobacterium RU_5_1]|nr:DUF1822 family protein [Leptolyngbyaceae cyanobacterium RU_5_1]